MPIVRESPRAHVSPSKNNAQWPPRSPFQALLSSPSGRKKWQDYKDRVDNERSPSPSPGRHNVRSSQLLQDMAGEGSGEDEDEDEEDEETLQLKLAEIQAKLKLKRMQSNKKKGEDGKRGEDRSSSMPSSSATPRKLYESALPPAAVEVPVSPAKEMRTTLDQVSPARARLGLTANPRAADVSLKRPRDSTALKRSTSQRSLRTSAADLPKPKSFSERLLESKQRDEQKEAKQDHLQKIRSSGFSHARTESAVSSKSHVIARSQTAMSGRASSLQEDARPSSAGTALDARREKKELTVSRSFSARYPRDASPSKAQPRKTAQSTSQEPAKPASNDEGDSDAMLGAQASQSDSGYDPFSEIHLKRREIPHSVVAREMQGKEVYPLPRLLKEVKSPEYEPPDCECDYVVFAVLASKSNPLDHAASHRTAEKHGADKLEAPKNKFMVLHLTDLKWEIDCYLFGTAFNQFWKLTPGTLLAIMNPAILPPKGNQHSGRFSLKLGSSEDAVMEIGIARDLGYCSAVKKDGQPCGEWIDKRKTEACEFHINLQVEKARKGRMEVNTMWNDGAKKDRPKSRVPQETRSKKGAGAYHREYGQLYSVNTGLGKSAASLLDDDDKKLMDGMTEEEASRKRIAAAQKDRDLARQLGEMGSGIGAEMMRNSKHVKAAAASSSSTTTTTAFASTRSTAEQARDDLFSKRSAAELGLLGKKASAASLEPAKDRRRHFGLGTLALSSSSSSSTRTRTRTANHSSDAMGWGGARTAGLLQPKAPPSTTRPPERSGGQKTRLDELETKRSNLVRPRSEESSVRSSGSQSPTKKKARFALDRGIREPGRESLPGQAEQMELVDSDDDDDDDLDIV